MYDCNVCIVQIRLSKIVCIHCIVDCRDEIVMIPSQRIIIYSTTKDWEAGQSRTPNLKFEIEMMCKKWFRSFHAKR